MNINDIEYRVPLQRYQFVHERLRVTISEESVKGCRITCIAEVSDEDITQGNWARFSFMLMCGKSKDSMQESGGMYEEIRFRENGKWYLLGKASFWLDYGPLENRSFYIGYKDRSLSLLGQGYRTQISDVYELDPYASLTKPPKLWIDDNGNNTFTISRNPMGTKEFPYSDYDGRHCYANNCQVYFNIDKTYSPSNAAGTYDGVFTNSNGAWKVDLSGRTPKDGDAFVIKVAGYTIGSVDNLSTHTYYSNISEMVSSTVNHYTSPNCENFKVTLKADDGKDPTAKATLIAEWEGLDKGNSNSLLSDSEIAIAITINDNPLYIDSSNGEFSSLDNHYVLLDGTSTWCNITNIINSQLGKFDNPIKLKKDDVIEINVNAYYICKDGTRLWCRNDEKHYASVTLKSEGVMRVKTDSKTWREGQTYIKTNSGWKEATNIYIKTESGWRESV